MKVYAAAIAFLLTAFAPGAAGAAEPASARPAEPAKVLAIFDFASAGDDGRLGKWVAANIRAKINRANLYVVVEQIDVAQACEASDFAPSFDTPIQAAADFARERLGCDLAMWGRVDRDGDALLIRVKLAATGEQAEYVLNETFTAENRHMTGQAVYRMIRALTGEPEPKNEQKPEWEKAWQEGPNLVKNPGFEDGEDFPEHWEPLNAKDYHHNGVSWVQAPGDDARGKCMKFEFDQHVAGLWGVAYYSEPIDTSQGTRYRFSVRVLSKAPTVKIFLKHYAYVPPTHNEQQGQWREVRRAPLNCHGADGQWRTFTRDFNPRLKATGYNSTDGLDEERAKLYDPKVTKVELYAYWPAGTVYFDDIVLKRLE